MAWAYTRSFQKGANQGEDRWEGWRWATEWELVTLVDRRGVMVWHLAAWDFLLRSEFWKTQLALWIVMPLPHSFGLYVSVFKYSSSLLLGNTGYFILFIILFLVQSLSVPKAPYCRIDLISMTSLSLCLIFLWFNWVDGITFEETMA